MNTQYIDALFQRKIEEVRNALAQQQQQQSADEVPFEVNKVLRQMRTHQLERHQKSLKNKSQKQ
jgi:hypothetical protein